MKQQPTKQRYALIVTILDPGKLCHRVLLLLVQGFRKEMNGKFPDRIEFTPELMKQFRREMGGEGSKKDKYLNIPCFIAPPRPTSHNLFTLKLPDVYT